MLGALVALNHKPLTGIFPDEQVSGNSIKMAYAAGRAVVIKTMKYMMTRLLPLGTWCGGLDNHRKLKEVGIW